MSKEAHPNINAAGLVSDLFNAIEIRIRGNAKKADRTGWVPVVADYIQEFSIKISEVLDEKFGRSG